MPARYYPTRLITTPGRRGYGGLIIPRRGSITRSEASRGTDAAGRFVGPGDFERAYAFFWRSRGQEPRSRDFAMPPEVKRALGPLAATPPRARPTGRHVGSGALSIERLREVWAARQRGATYEELAVQFEVSHACIKAHFARGGSASMRAARAAGPIGT